MTSFDMYCNGVRFNSRVVTMVVLGGYIDGGDDCCGGNDGHS